MHEPHSADVVWRKSRRSGAQGNCVELAALTDRTVGVRNSRFPDGAALAVPAAGVAALLDAVKAGSFDTFLGDGDSKA